MTDIVDAANDHVETEREAQTQACSLAAAHRLPATGSCYHCGEDVAEPRLFCDLDCSVDYERKRAADVRRFGR